MTKKPPVFRPKFLQSTTDRVKQYDRWRGSAYERGYDRKWQKARDLHIKRFPLCNRCSTPECPVLADLVHHVIPVDKASELRLVETNLESLCSTCHGKEHAEH